MAERQTLLESIRQRVSDWVNRTDMYDDEPESDSSIETREESGTDTADILGGAWDWYTDQIGDTSNTRRGKYRDYEKMDREDPILSSALDVYADNATKGDQESDEVLQCVSDEENVKEVIDRVKKELNLDRATWSLARSLAKYGDVFEEVVVDDQMDIRRMKHLPAETMQVVWDKYGRFDPETPYKQVDADTLETIAEFARWQVLHFQLNKDRNSRYGVDGSILYPIRKVYKQLSMMEDSLIIARLTRAQQRYGILVDVEGIEPGKPTRDYINKVKNDLKKKRTINQRTGELDLKQNPLAVEEDIFVGVRQNSRADVKVLQASTNIGELRDVQYFQNKIFAGIKVPKPYLGFERDVTAKATMTQQDVQFARTVRRIQIALLREYHRLMDLALTLAGISPMEVEYSLQLPIISTIDELNLWQVKLTRARVAQVLRQELGVSARWIMSELLEMSDADIEEIVQDYIDPDSVDNRLMMAQMELPDELEDFEDIATEGREDDVDLSDREIGMLQYKLSEEIEALKDLLDWKLKGKHLKSD